MIAQPKLGQNICPHCWGRKMCDCASCGQRAWYISFGGKMYKYYESRKCKVCDGKGVLADTKLHTG